MKKNITFWNRYFDRLGGCLRSAEIKDIKNSSCFSLSLMKCIFQEQGYDQSDTALLLWKLYIQNIKKSHRIYTFIFLMLDKKQTFLFTVDVYVLIDLTWPLNLPVKQSKNKG